MNPNEFQPTFTEQPPGQRFLRLQRLRAMPGSIRANGFILPGRDVLNARFDVADVAVAYLADSELTALYETLFRRTAQNCSWDLLEVRALTEFRSVKPLRLVDLRGLEEKYPFLVSQRLHETQALAKRWHQDGLDGVLYASAQHPQHDCTALFPQGIEKVKRVKVTPLIHPFNSTVLKSVLEASSYSRVPVVRG